MKTLFTILTISISQLIFSAPNKIEFVEEVFTAKEMVSLNKLKCILNLGSNVLPENREVTTLEGLRFGARDFPTIHFEHSSARTLGCDMAALDKLVDDSFLSVSHAEVLVTLIQTTAKEPRLYRGQCMRSIREQIIMDFEQGTILKTSQLGKLIPATGC